jgi:hypothetical protein
MIIKSKAVLYLIYILCFISCNSKKNFTINKTLQIQQETSQIVFLIFRINKGLDAENSTIELINTIKKEGIIKKQLKSNIESENYLLLEIYNNNKIEKTQKIAHPLLKEIEYFNENKKINKKNIELNSEDFSIRLQIKNVNASIKIFEKLKNKPEMELISLKI